MKFLVSQEQRLRDLCITRPVAAQLGHSLPSIRISSLRLFDAWSITSAFRLRTGTLVCQALGLPARRRDALELWPADLHVIGKKILKFIAVYWPLC